jgi:hypothetical protein
VTARDRGRRLRGEELVRSSFVAFPKHIAVISTLRKGYPGSCGGGELLAAWTCVDSKGAPDDLE